MQHVSKRASRTRELFVAHAPLWLDANLGPGRLSAGIIAANLDNPGARQVARVLGLLGMNDVFANVELPDAADPTKRLNEMVGVRNSIAHGGFPSVGDDQAWDYVNSVEAIGDGLEQEVARHIQMLCRLKALPRPEDPAAPLEWQRGFRFSVKGAVFEGVLEGAHLDVRKLTEGFEPSTPAL
jgi:hypothetical protein